MDRDYFNSKEPLLKQLSEKGLEFDQKLSCALEISASKPDLKPEDRGFPDSYLFIALYRMNTVITRLIKLDESRMTPAYHDYRIAPRCKPEEVIPGERLRTVLDKIIKGGDINKTIGAGHFLRAIAKISLKDIQFEYMGGTFHKTFSVESLMWGLGYTAWTAVEAAPKVRNILREMEKIDPIEDFQYILTLEGDGLAFRVVSVLNDYWVEGKRGEVIPFRALLTHLEDRYGGFTEEEIRELESLVESRSTKESDLQKFFERHPHFLRMWDYRDVFPQVYLTREEDADLIPDFILTNREAYKAMILDLKKPNAKLITRQTNRERFAATISTAKAQLLEYKRWFEDRANREKIKDTLGVEIYEPKLAVVIGRSSEFKTPFERQKIASAEPGLEIITYDDILNYANNRRLIISPRQNL